MQPDSADVLKTGTIIQYPSIRISKGISVLPGQAELAILDDEVKEAERIKLIHKISNGIPLEILKKKSGVLATTLVHEIRNPLANISLAADILSLGQVEKEQHQFTDIIKRGVERINHILTSFLTAQNDEEIQSEPCSINQLLEEALLINRDRISLKKVVVRKNFAADDLTILVRKQEIKMALINIIVNAIEAMASTGGILILSSSLINGQCLIEIQDNGIGISEKNLPSIFDPYYTSKSGGLGLGLSTTMDILLSNCGTMDVRSEEGTGTHFMLRFNPVSKDSI